MAKCFEGFKSNWITNEIITNIYISFCFVGLMDYFVFTWQVDNFWWILLWNWGFPIIYIKIISIFVPHFYSLVLDVVVNFWHLLCLCFERRLALFASFFRNFPPIQQHLWFVALLSGICTTNIQRLMWCRPKQFQQRWQ